MVKLLKCQEDTTDVVGANREELKAFAIALLSHLLEIYEGDLIPEEERDIDYFIKDWLKK